MKREIMLVLTAACALLSVDTEGREPDGCAQLAALVFDSVLHSGAGLPTAARTPAAGRKHCGTVAATASRAYTAALARMNIHVAWRGQINPGDYCLSHDITQCYPDRHPMIPPGGAADTAFLRSSWSAVQGTLAANAGPGLDADRLSYEPARLQRSLQMAVRRAARSRVIEASW